MSNYPTSNSDVKQHRNEVHLRGVLARDPEARRTSTGKLVANVVVATTHEKRTEFTRCTFWEEKAERLSHAFRKGDLISLHGYLETRSWVGNDGAKHYSTSVVVWNFSDGSTVSEPNAIGGTAIAHAVLRPGVTRG